MSESFIVKAGSTVTEGMALAFTGTEGEVDIAGIGDEALFAGFAVNGADGGESVAARLGIGTFIASALLAPSDAGAELKMAAAGQLVKAAATDAYVAKYYPMVRHAGGGGVFFAGKGSEVTAGHFGRCRVSEGVKA